MGILDDAIREHLELKRRRGGDPSEIDRMEREALGPVRRGPHDAADLLVDEETVPRGSYPIDEEVPRWEESAEEAAPFDHAVESSPEPPSAEWSEPELPREYPAPAAAGYEPDTVTEAAPDRRSERPRHHEIAEEWEAHARQELAGEPAGFEPDELAPAPPASAPETPPPAPSFEEETAEYEVEKEEQFDRPPTEPAESEDVLEETPDFLQDTPDHDRLWFEQRPPRDFDFDG